MTSTNTIPLYLCTYNRGKDLNGVTKPFHWSLFVGTNVSNSEEGIVHQLRGMPGGFHYPGAEPVSKISSVGPGRMEDMVEIGEIPNEDVASIEGLLRQIDIIKDESSDWNCQDWTEAACVLLKGKGWVHQQIDTVKTWVKGGEEKT